MPPAFMRHDAAWCHDAAMFAARWYASPCLLRERATLRRSMLADAADVFTMFYADICRCHADICLRYAPFAWYATRCRHDAAPALMLRRAAMPQPRWCRYDVYDAARRLRRSAAARCLLFAMLPLLDAWWCWCWCQRHAYAMLICMMRHDEARAICRALPPPSFADISFRFLFFLSLFFRLFFAFFSLRHYYWHYCHYHWLHWLTHYIDEYYYQYYRHDYAFFLLLSFSILILFAFRYFISWCFRY